MGALKSFNLQELKNKFNLSVFIETGLGWGDGLAEACRFDFRELYSIEISKKVVDKILKEQPSLKVGQLIKIALQQL